MSVVCDKQVASGASVVVQMRTLRPNRRIPVDTDPKTDKIISSMSNTQLNICGIEIRIINFLVKQDDRSEKTSSKLEFFKRHLDLLSTVM